MKKSIERYIERIRQAKAARRKAVAVVLALSFAVSGNVFWFLRGIGTAMTDLPSGDGDGSYQTDELSDSFLYARENVSYWEETIPELTGIPSEDLVNVAASQAGYKESGSYSRYGDWYGNPEGEWNVMFVSFCLNYAGLSENQIPYGSGCWAWQVELNEAGLLVLNEEGYLPEAQRGDIVLIDSDSDGRSDLAGIVFEVNEDGITVLEGDVDGSVDAVTYQNADDTFFGLVNVSAFDPEKANEEKSPEENANEEKTPDGEIPEGKSPDKNNTEEVIPNEDIQAETENEDDKEYVEYNAVTESGIEVVARAEAGVFAEDVTMVCEDAELPETIEETVNGIDEEKELKSSVAVDITFVDGEGEEVEPDEGSTVEVVITLPEGTLTEGDEFVLFHMSEEGPEEVGNADINETTASFTAEGFSIYVITALGERDKDKVHESLPAFGVWGDEYGYVHNSAESPYIIFVGETVVLEGKNNYGFAYFGNDQEYIIRRVEGSSVEKLYQDDNGYYCSRGEFLALAPGMARLTFDTGAGGVKEFYIQVKGNTSQNHTFNFATDMGLIPYRYPDNPINLQVGDTFTVLAAADWIEHRFFYVDRDGNFLDASDYIEATSGIMYPENNRFSQTFRAKKASDGDVVAVAVHIGNTGNAYDDWRYIYFRVNPTDHLDLLDHADIEVADDGTDTASKIYNTSEGLFKTVVTRKTFVCGVNSCTLYESTDDSVPTTFYHEVWPNGVYSFEEYEGVHGYVESDYWQDPNKSPGDTQYELTSKYVLGPDGSVVSWSNKKFYYDDVDHAVFDVQLELRPVSEITYKYNSATGGWDEVPGSAKTYTEQEGKDNKQIIDSAIFTLDHRSVIDAYNKCPHHSGFDFTVRSSSASIVFEANKELQGGTLADNQFTFVIFDPNDNSTIATAKNKADGTVEFEDLYFDTAGTYNYKIREVNTGDPSIIYDDSVFDIEIEVTADDMGILTPNFSKKIYDTYESDELYQFKNIKQFVLPNTGGTGITPYMAAGAALIAGALILLLRRKRREVGI